jgi:hypothetical protein
MKTFPKLRYPIHTKGLNTDDRNILLAYDCIYRAKKEFEAIEQLKEEKLLGSDLAHDMDANLANLGHHIEQVICAGQMSLRFEGFSDEVSGVDVFPKE